MSVRVMTAVFERYPVGGGEMLLALALADHASDDGSRVYPSVEALAEKTRQSVRSVQYQLRKMQQVGWLILVGAGHGGRGMSREYRINQDWINGADFAPIKKGAIHDAKGAIHDTKGAKQSAKGCNGLHPHITINEPSITINEPSLIGADAQKAKPASRATVLPDDFQPNETAQQMAAELGLDLQAELAAFCDHHAAKGTTFKDWQAGMRTWLRNAAKYRQQARPGGRGGAGQQIDPHAPVETYAQRAARQRVEEVAPGAARKAPGQRCGFERAQMFMNGGDVIDVTPVQQRQIGG